MEIEFVQLLQDMLGDLEGNHSIEVKIFGDDAAVLAELGEMEEMLGKVEGLSISSVCRAKSRGRSIRRRPAIWA